MTSDASILGAQRTKLGTTNLDNSFNTLCLNFLTYRMGITILCINGRVDVMPE